MIVFDEVEGISLTSIEHFRMDWRFRLDDGGALRALAYGESDDLFATSYGFEVSRNGEAFSYLYHLTTGTEVTDAFDALPSDPDADLSIVTEFYENVEDFGYSANEAGISAWPINDTDPTNCEGIGLSDGASGFVIQNVNPAGREVGFALNSATLISVLTTGSIVGACE